MNKVFVVTILDYCTGCDKLFPDREILGVGVSLGVAMKMARERLEKVGILSSVWYTSPTERWAHTDNVRELVGAEIRAYDVIK